MLGPARPLLSVTRRRRVAASALLATALGAALVAAPAPAAEGDPATPWFEHARVDLMEEGGFGRALPDPPPPDEHEHEETGEAGPEGSAPGLPSPDDPTHEHDETDGHDEQDEGAATGGGIDGGPTTTTGAATPRREAPPAGADDASPAPGWSAVAELPIDGQFVVLEWSGDPAATFQIRSRNDEVWSEWVVAHVDGDERPDANEPGVDVQSLGPVYVGEDAEAVEVVVEAGRPDDLSLLVMESHEPEGFVEPTDQAPALTAPADAAGRSTATGMPAAPPMFSASQWGSKGWAYGNSGCGNGPTVASSLRFAVVHHTVSTNDYSTSQADDQIRAIYDYHVNSRGWCDIAYNFVVDKYGTVWEGRTGSANGPVQGGHASGFNSGSMGVVLLGQYHPGASPPASTVSTAQYNGVRDLIAWKFGLHGVDALGTTKEVSGGSSSIPAGTTVTLKTIIGHRDVGSTGCPGDNAYKLLPNWRTDVAARVNAAPSGASRPAAANNADGRMEVFAIGGDGTVRHGWQSKPNQGPWLGWYTLNPTKFTGGVAVAPNKDGRLELFTRSSTGRVQHAWQTTPNGIWSPFESLGGTARGDVAAGRNTDGRLEAYYTGTDGRVYNNWQWSPGGNWSGWSSLGGSFTGSPGVGMNKDGRQELAIVGNDGRLYHNWQQVPNGWWSGWFSLGGSLKGDPAVGSNADGRMEMFAVGKDGQLWHNWQWKPNGVTGWSGWHPMGGSFQAGPAVNRNIDGRMELVIYGNDGRLYNNWQVVPNGGWSGWHALSTKLR